MTRVVAVLALAAVLIVGVVLLTSGGDDKMSSPQYKVELDNASGLTEGADLRVAGVQVGAIKKLDLDAKTARAIATISVDKPEFGGLRKDASCTIKPQSLIGEYYMDCDPGVAKQQLGYDGTIPIDRTSGTIPPDLVMNTLSMPYREKLSVLLSELGAGFAARGGDVNETIRRAIPALRDTDNVLKILADERGTLSELTRNADTVVGRLNGNRENVARFVSSAGRTATISANRRTELAGTIRRLPTFERVLRPTLRDLGVAAKRQTPALRNLRIAAPSLTTLLNRLGPFATASRPAVKALGRASVTGTQATKDARPFVTKLRAAAKVLKDPVTNLRYVLEQLDDRGAAVEKNPESPGGLGFTGLEAVMQYFFTQSQAINVFDSRGYVLKLDLLVNECSNYTNGSTALASPERTKKCSGALGPGGKIEPTPNSPVQTRSASGSSPASTATNTTTGSAPATPDAASTPAAPAVTTPAVPSTSPLPLPTGDQPAPQAAADLLDFLLG